MRCSGKADSRWVMIGLWVFSESVYGTVKIRKVKQFPVWYWYQSGGMFGSVNKGIHASSNTRELHVVEGGRKMVSWHKRPNRAKWAQNTSNLGTPPQICTYFMGPAESVKLTVALRASSYAIRHISACHTHPPCICLPRRPSRDAWRLWANRPARPTCGVLRFPCLATKRPPRVRSTAVKARLNRSSMPSRSRRQSGPFVRTCVPSR